MSAGRYGISTRDLARRAATTAGRPGEQLGRDLDVFLDELVAALDAGEKVNLRGIGVLTVRVKPASRRRRPDTGEPVDVSERRTVAFKPSRALKERLNAGP